MSYPLKEETPKSTFIPVTPSPFVPPPAEITDIGKQSLPASAASLNIYSEPLPGSSRALVNQDSHTAANTNRSVTTFVGDNLNNSGVTSDSVKDNKMETVVNDKDIAPIQKVGDHSISGEGCTPAFIIDMPSKIPGDGLDIYKYLLPLVGNDTAHIYFEKFAALGACASFHYAADILRAPNVLGQAALQPYVADLYRPKEDAFAVQGLQIDWSGIVDVGRIDPTVIDSYTDSYSLLDVRKIQNQLAVFFGVRGNSILNGLDQILVNQNSAIGFYSKAWFMLLQDVRDNLNGRAIPDDFQTDWLVIYDFTPPAADQADNRNAFISQLLAAAASGELVLEWGAQIGNELLPFLMSIAAPQNLPRPQPVVLENSYASDFINWQGIRIHVVVRPNTLAPPAVPIPHPQHYAYNAGVNFLINLGEIYGIANDIMPGLQNATELYWSTFLPRYNPTSMRPPREVDVYRDMRQGYPANAQRGFDYHEQREDAIPIAEDNGSYRNAYRKRFLELFYDQIVEHYGAIIPQNWQADVVLRNMNVRRRAEGRSGANVAAVSAENQELLNTFQRTMRNWLRIAHPAPVPIAQPVQEYRVCTATNQIYATTSLPATSFLCWFFVLPKTQMSLSLDASLKDSLSWIGEIENLLFLRITATASILLTLATSTFMATYSITGRDLTRILQGINLNKVFTIRLRDGFFLPHQCYVKANPVYTFIRSFIYHTTGSLLSAENTTLRAWGVERVVATYLPAGDWYYINAHEFARPYLKLEPQTVFPILLVRPLDWVVFTRNPIVNVRQEVLANADEVRQAPAWLSHVGCSKFYIEAAKTRLSFLCRNIPYGIGVISALLSYASYGNAVPQLSVTQWPVSAIQQSNQLDPIPVDAPAAWNILPADRPGNMLRIYHWLPYDHDADMIRFVALTPTRNIDNDFNPIRLLTYSNMEAVGAGVSSNMADRSLFAANALATWSDAGGDPLYEVRPMVQMRAYRPRNVNTINQQKWEGLDIDEPPIQTIMLNLSSNTTPLSIAVFTIIIEYLSTDFEMTINTLLKYCFNVKSIKLLAFPSSFPTIMVLSNNIKTTPLPINLKFDMTDRIHFCYLVIKINHISNINNITINVILGHSFPHYPIYDGHFNTTEKTDMGKELRLIETTYRQTGPNYLDLVSQLISHADRKTHLQSRANRQHNFD